VALAKSKLLATWG